MTREIMGLLEKHDLRIHLTNSRIEVEDVEYHRGMYQDIDSNRDIHNIDQIVLWLIKKVLEWRNIGYDYCS